MASSATGKKRRNRGRPLAKHIAFPYKPRLSQLRPTRGRPRPAALRGTIAMIDIDIVPITVLKNLVARGRIEPRTWLTRTFEGAGSLLLISAHRLDRLESLAYGAKRTVG